MRVKASGKLSTAFLVFLAVVLTSIIGNAQIPTPTADWVNIKDPKFGAIGDGSHDDTAAIQKAIDYAFNNRYSAVYCPAGKYVTSNTIWLDPPGNLRATTWTGTGYISGTTLTISSTTTGTFGGVYAYVYGSGVAVPTVVVAGSGPTYTVNNSQTVGSSGSPVALTATTPSSPTNFGFSTAFFGDPAAGGDYQGCQIQPTFNDATAFMVGPGQGMRVSDISVTGPGGSYRGQQNANGVGIGLTGGNGGSSINLIENTIVNNFYALYETDVNGGCCLNDSNTWRQVTGNNAYYGIQILGTQSDINNVFEPRIQNMTVGISSQLARPVNVYGGNVSAGLGQDNSFTLSNISSFSKVSDGNGYDYSFTATVASPDQYVGSVYNAYMIVTAHFGVVPLTMTAWNANTNVGTFEIWPPWDFANYGVADLTTTTDIQTEVAAVTTIYAAERVTVAWGMGIVLDGVHIENPEACQTLYHEAAGFLGATSSEVRNVYFNGSNPSAPSGTANSYCAQTFPFIYQEPSSYGATLVLNNGNLGDTTLPLIIDGGSGSIIEGSALTGIAGSFNMRVYDNGGYAYEQINAGNQLATVARGNGTWDNDYFMPPAANGYGLGGNIVTFLFHGELSAPFCGYEPCPWAISQLNAANYALVSGTLGALGTYPPIACRTIYKSLDFNTGSAPTLFLRSASCPGWSWGQNLTTALVGENLTWSYKGQSDALYLDTSTLSWMFPGLGISINNGNGAQAYTVTGVYPSLGYVTVISAQNRYGGPLVGTKTTVYSCSSGCSILQAPFSWTAY